ncbi:DUF7373 family lipoprotein [Nocardia miyunensis]|uniref:DUF7373 family lipoprotein n=1 Tax=Nocardia miyunensis TaxID=282684 RepID=UPI0008344725|nr:hypothetical protein [Nocardia miyunensis]
MVRTTRRAGIVFATATAVAVLAGCGVQGTPVAGEIDVRTLDVGNYAVDQHAYHQTADDAGAVVEGMRMSRAVVPAVRIDPSLKVGQGGHIVLDNTEATTRLLAAVSKPILDREGLLTGYTAAGADKPDEPGTSISTSDTTSVTDFVMRFADADTAKRTAQELEDADFGVAPDLNKKLTLSKYPDALVHWRPGISNVGAFLAHKNFVISLFIQRPEPDQDDLEAWVQKSLDAQVPALDRFQATPKDQFSSLPIDPDGLLARAVVRDRDVHTPDRDRFASYGPNDFVNIAEDETTRQRLVDDTGLDAVGIADTSTVLRVRDAAAGGRLVNGLVSASGSGYSPTDAPDGIPGAKCLQLGSSSVHSNAAKFRCYIPHGRYVEVVISNDQSDMKKKASAAYALLANSM